MSTVAILILVGVVNVVGLAMTLLQLPGNWVIVLGCIAAWCWCGDQVGGGAVAAVFVLAVLGEVLEFITGAVGARKAGGSRRGALLAIGGGVAGAIVGSLAIPILILGTILGAALGAAMFSVAGDLWAGRTLGGALRAGRGAAVGKVAGTVLKLAVGAAMCGVYVVAVLWP